MKERPLYIFFSDEDIVSELKKKLNIQEPNGDELQTGNFESGSSFESQLKEANWSEVGNGRYTVFYHIVAYNVEDDDGSPLPATNIGHSHVIIKHQTKEVIREENSEKIREALTVLDESDMI